ncbi:aryl-alcohol dehydrogenase-like predicted oxidoreductase [Pantoea sp. PA1]|jgi:aryl-alcohol dehydrogenase-like predicted oxidoreductase|uniref:Protein tas n=1 Tax=Pantoea ananas TaxID=553 RepID=A0A8A4KBQ4_PANAN|nr:NADP(H)-dependent aldo-keto reductase [Pantoea ananatis]MDC7865915.1 NADP(H)-dependent aldo-keto reductase [Pantoea ananatis]MDH0055312.1 NADP(H)-dependent aldo-keto reductase [Pantoea ananatis]MDQ1224528.1 aryl-alcohol dehydrogenase-like predicted oxidoreductase [Pantoea ananatis]MDR6090376.1 aryl-alcohol dehydrogenase-like predicted oxidoreductase [Pantoea ananatis]PQL01811.1 NADP(H)-dependent aldo-keto reductase [Pantoea ananatis]
MHYHRIPHSSLEVSQLGLGTMTFGEQNSEADAHAQLDLALSSGINLIDTAEMYPVPPRPETQGLTEKYIGSWLKKTGSRDKIVLASKVAGPTRGNDASIRPNMALDRKNIREALDASLKRLNTDYIDLYQLHWPQRQTNFFGKLGYQYSENSVPVTLLETLEALAEQVRAGKIRYIGVSNETPWGVMRYLQLAEKHELPRIVSIQNPYSLLNRSFEVGLAEISQHEGVELLAYSCLAFGTLSGKYLNGAQPAGARNTLFSRFTRYSGEQSQLAVAEYVALAQKHQLDPSQMALAFVRQQSFVSSTLLGATTLDQLKINIDSANVTLSNEVLEELEAIHRRYTYPAP